MAARYHGPPMDLSARTVADDLKTLFKTHDLEFEECSTAFLAKVVVCKKTDKRHFRTESAA